VLKLGLQDMDEIKTTFEKQQAGILTRRNSSIKERRNYLRKIHAWIHANREAIHLAMFDDFRKPLSEVDSAEIFHVLNEINLATEKLDEWAAPKKVDAPITLIGTRSFIQHEPKGVCLIISPWNYPFSLCLGPLVSALAAGNSVIIKPSELTPNVSKLIKKFSQDIFTDDLVAVFEGGPEVSQYLTSLPFDHIFFTGSSSIGKAVMKAAADNLTSVTLELGGKTPTIVTESARLKDAAERIAVAKFINNGQTCVAPDYILVHKSISSNFISLLIAKTQKSFSEQHDFEGSSHYARIVNDKHFSRLAALLEDAQAKGAKTSFGGQSNEASRFFHPTLLTDVPKEARVMEEEIFGPILPIITYNNFDEVINLINSKPKPLALYIFSSNQKERDRILKETSSGGVCVNECAIQFLHHNLPFGGVNNSGHGKSHGHAGFLAFSHEKSVMKQKNGFTSVKLFYPPYTKMKKKLMAWFINRF
jgi:aldehyde dehydrogenase (NAD+)